MKTTNYESDSKPFNLVEFLKLVERWTTGNPA